VNTMRKLLPALLLFLTLPAAAENTRPLKTVCHVHTAYSIKPAGDVLFIAKKARAAGADVLITGDDNTAEFEYGLWPLRGLIKYRVSANSVTKAGPDLFLAHLAHVQKQVPDLLIIPGVEAAPFYFWTGNPVTGLKINNWHRHFSVIGMNHAEDYYNMPLTGNRSSYHFAPAALWPVLLLGLAAFLFFCGMKKAALIFAAVGFIFTADKYPFTKPAFNQYSDSGWAPYEKMVSYAREKNALVFINHPEAGSWDNAVKLTSRVSIQTPQYPESLEKLPQAHGFAAYATGNRHMTEPGGYWDKAINAYLTGMRKTPPWAYAETDYGGDTKNGAKIDESYMMVYAATATQSAVLAALKTGAFYCVRPADAGALALTRWSASADGKMVSAGQTLSAKSVYRMDAEIAAARGTVSTATASIICGGSTVAEKTGSLPFSLSYTGKVPDKNTFCRLMAKHSANGYMLANPIFITKDRP